jgi:hypothetical protein
MGIISEQIVGDVINVTIASSNLKSASYNTTDETLTVYFNTGAVYTYYKIPWGVFTKFRMSDSQGKFFSSVIKKYEYKKIQ